MYDIRQFKPTLYLLVLLGMTGFWTAAEEPALWMASTVAVLFNAWLVRSNRFKPLPRWIANTITLLSMLYMADQVFHLVNTPILLIGEYLVFLQVIKLFEQRANRDYAQLLILSFLLMVSAAISTARLGFALLFFPYLVVLLYGCLLFHLKVESDRARSVQSLLGRKLNAATLRQDQRHLPRSMRRLTGLMCTVCLVCAVFVFFFFPRGAPSKLFGQSMVRPPEVLTGFSDDVQLNQVAQITQNNTQIASVKVTHNGALVNSGVLALRGATFDRWTRKGSGGPWHWQHSARAGPELLLERSIDAGEIYPIAAAGLPTEQWRQAYRLEPLGSKVLLALGGARSFQPRTEARLGVHHDDDTLQRMTGTHLSIEYEVVSSGVLSYDRGSDRDAGSEIAAEIRDFARDLGVNGLSRGELDARLALGPGVAAGDERIAGNIERYFKSHFSYTLDLTDSASLFVGKDPLAVFVSQTKRGHCEYFAGAMTVACQSLGLRARQVIGFHTDEYNRYSEQFQVRQSHAHAWVEVLTDQGWVSFDPTSGREYPPNESRSMLRRLKHVFDWLEFKWGTSVVAYDGTRRESVVQKLETSMVNSAIRGQDRWTLLGRWWDRLLQRTEFWTVSSKLLAGFIALMAAGIVGAVTWFMLERHRIRRRAIKIGLNTLPVSEQIRLARQLGFYEQMTAMLHRRRITRPAHLTPREFSRTLTFLPTEAFEMIERLTGIFYRVRYGGARVQSTQQRRLAEAIARLDAAMGPLKPN